MTKRTVTIELASGLEARPIAMLVQLASSYESTIYVQSDNKKINAKSIMGMMTLDLPVGEQVVVTADGVDEEKAVNEAAYGQRPGFLFACKADKKRHVCI